MGPNLQMDCVVTPISAGFAPLSAVSCKVPYGLVLLSLVNAHVSMTLSGTDGLCSTGSPFPLNLNGTCPPDGMRVVGAKEQTCLRVLEASASNWHRVTSTTLCWPKQISRLAWNQGKGNGLHHCMKGAAESHCNWLDTGAGSIGIVFATHLPESPFCPWESGKATRWNNWPLRCTCDLCPDHSGSSFPRPLCSFQVPGHVDDSLSSWLLVSFLQSCLTFWTMWFTEIILLTEDIPLKILGGPVLTVESLRKHIQLLLTCKRTLAVERISHTYKKERSNFKVKGPFLSLGVFLWKLVHWFFS